MEERTHCWHKQGIRCNPAAKLLQQHIVARRADMKESRSEKTEFHIPNAMQVLVYAIGHTRRVE